MPSRAYIVLECILLITTALIYQYISKISCAILLAAVLAIPDNTTSVIISIQ
ncbi:hypothetical protein GOY12_02325 [Wolbachia endosymbiont of Dirofilaria (Dirofilaria) immitis]|nr:hypothetical protein GOY12_02325 [Wolbachia endosymbiont of Dirofilaria (Dirofilaria) immitis]